MLEYCLGEKNLENLLYYLTYCPSYILQPRKTTINTLPCSLSPTPFVEHIQKSQIYLFKTRCCLLNIFLTLYCFQIFVLIIETTKHSTWKQWNWFCGKRHHSCEIRCPVFTPSQLFIARVIMGHVLFLPWLFLGQWVTYF